MTASTQTVGGNTTVSFSYTASTQTMLNVLGNYAMYLWNLGFGDHGTDENPIDFDSLTTTQKLALIDSNLRSEVVTKSREQYVNDAVAAARQTAVTEAGSLDIGG